MTNHSATSQADADLLADLLLRWQALRDLGRPVSAEELCPSRPELAADLRARMRALAAMEAALGLGAGETPPDPSAGSGAALTPPPRDGATDALPTPTVPGYEILGELARGGMGVVYRARQVALNRVVALKMILAGARAGPERRERFRTEAEAVARLRHPHIVQVFEAGEWAGQPFLAMGLLAGGSLAQQLTQGCPPPRAAAQLLATLARAVQHAHDCGIVHRDLKPANVLLSAEGTPKVGDFGLARLLDRDAGGPTHTGAILGTPSYLAPEQALGRTRAAGPAADVYALGAILYECLTGRPPFVGETILDTLEQVRSADPAPPRRLRPRLARDLEAICLKCLEKGPSRRYPSAGALADDLERWLAGEAVVARSRPLWARAARRARRRPALAALVVVTALAAASVLGFWARFTVQLGEERALARREAGRARDAEAAALGQRRRAEAERDDARRQRGRAEVLLDRSLSAITAHAVASRSAKNEAGLTANERGVLLLALARFYAGTSAAYARDRDLAPPDRARLAERYAARAVSLLDSARTVGYFRDPRNRLLLREDGDLEPLRRRKDFQRVLALAEE